MIFFYSRSLHENHELKTRYVLTYVSMVSCCVRVTRNAFTFFYLFFAQFVVMVGSFRQIKMGKIM